MGKQKRYTHLRETITASPPPKKTWQTPSYRLERFLVRRHVHVVTVRLEGVRGSVKCSESISFPLLPNVSDADLVRAAAWFSPHRWLVPFGMNVSQFQGKFTSPVDEALLHALMHSSRGKNHPHLAQPSVPTGPGASLFQPPLSQPGQFHPSTNTQYAPLFPANKRIPWQWYRTRGRKLQMSLGCGALIVFFVFVSIMCTAFGSATTTLTPTSTPTRLAVAPATATPTDPKAQPTLVPTVQPRPTTAPRIRPTARPTTPRPVPSPHPPTPCPGVNCNPWGYTFTPGRLIYTPPSNFCSYFNCIPSFWEPDDPDGGYIVQCSDGSYSQSGGERGACSHHGGVGRALYAH